MKECAGARRRETKTNRVAEASRDSKRQPQLKLSGGLGKCESEESWEALEGPGPFLLKRVRGLRAAGNWCLIQYEATSRTKNYF